jgi:hypothetical protein
MLKTLNKKAFAVARFKKHGNRSRSRSKKRLRPASAHLLGQSWPDYWS